MGEILVAGGVNPRNESIKQKPSVQNIWTMLKPHPDGTAMFLKGVIRLPCSPQINNLLMKSLGLNPVWVKYL
jgi:hypothetical protein